MRRAVAVAAAALTVGAMAGCGAPAKLSTDDGRRLAGARERLDDAIDTEEALRTSKVEARRLRERVRRLVSGGDFEDERLDEFGIAKLGQLREVVPSLVIVDAEGDVRALDRPATEVFLRFADRDAARALLGPASKQVSVMVQTLDETDAGSDTDIPVVRMTAEAYLREAARDVSGIWPSQARRLTDARDAL